ncbi:helix-turn-helix domain-containing protein [Streptomyces sp. NPDC056069]|uniref:helix-turn-helix domain-containing protein n=1 Tax=Streptomyces sp. NPDC056069 TaxID=3345702 RepID=UPI0035E064A9
MQCLSSLRLLFLLWRGRSWPRPGGCGRRFDQGRSGAETAQMLGVSEESVRRRRRVREEGGADALRRLPATGRPGGTRPRSSGCGPRWSRVRRPMVSRPICGRWNGSVWSSSG